MQSTTDERSVAVYRGLEQWILAARSGRTKLEAREQACDRNLRRDLKVRERFPYMPGIISRREEHRHYSLMGVALDWTGFGLGDWSMPLNGSAHLGSSKMRRKLMRPLNRKCQQHQHAQHARREIQQA